MLVSLLALLAAAAMAVGANVAWPSAVIEEREFYAGRTEQFPPGTVTAVPGVHGYEGRPGFFVVRLHGGEFLALGGVDPYSGCAVEYLPDLDSFGREGWFRDPCRWSTYDMAGDRVFRPSWYSLDRLAVEIRDGGVFVDPTAVTRRVPVWREGYGDETGGELRPLPFTLPRATGAR